jgi:hypothetical protein
VISGASSGSVHSARRPLEAEALADFAFFFRMTVPHRNDAAVVAAFGPNENHHPAVKPSCGDIAILTPTGLIAHPCRVISFEHSHRVGEIKATMG